MTNPTSVGVAREPSQKWRIETKYRKAEIEPLICIGETAHFVTVLEPPFYGKGEPTPRRQAKKGDWHEFHNTWEAAKERLEEIAQQELITARNALQRAQDFAGNVKGLRNRAAIAAAKDQAPEGAA